MAELKLDFSRTVGFVKPMHAVNNGPLRKRTDQTNDNYDSYKGLGIPFARNHDASFWPDYGGEHTVDVCAIFPNFDADENDPQSYDFVLTDEYIERTLSVGTETFYRLGSKIEHNIKKYGTLPPKDFAKWARICEHIIRHMNYGWADGHHFGIRYWEIWNEPDIDLDDSENKRNWGGTKAQFFDFYETAAKHLKSCFPELKIGGPAIGYRVAWAEDFLREMQTRGVEMDFFSWHAYAYDTDAMVTMAGNYRVMLDKYGYSNAESILDEWNYVKNWGSLFVYSVKTIIGMKGAAFVGDAMCRLEHEPVDMLMYYDARPSGFNGLWDFYDRSKQLKSYYAFEMFSRLYQMGGEIETPLDVDGISAVAARNEKEGGIMLCYYTDDDDCTEEKTVDITLDGAAVKGLSLSVLDESRDNERSELAVSNSLRITLRPNTLAYVSLNF